MLFEIAGKCKQCGAELHVMLSSADKLVDIERLVRCSSCGHHANYRDAETFNHLLDILSNRVEGNSTVDVSKIVIHRR